METSKKITWLLIIFFLLALIAVGVVKIMFGIDISSLLNYIMPLTTSCTLAYFGKASLENVTKIKTGSNSAVQVDSGVTSIEVQPTIISDTPVSAVQSDVQSAIQSAVIPTELIGR